MKRDLVAVIGTGLMGSGIAAISALAGEPTVLVNPELDLARGGYDKALEHIAELADNGLASAADALKAQSLLSIAGDIREVLPRVGLVIEAIFEDMKAKQAVFKDLDALLPAEVPILSNTSGLRITEIAALTQKPQRTMTAHFWFPAHLVPLVEVVMSEHTDLDMALAVKERLAKWGKAPVLVKRDLPGQLANRILQAVIREAVNIVDMGLATPEDVDTAVKMGMGIRLPAWGILEHVDGVGVDLCRSVQNTVLPGISAAQEANPLFDKLISNGDLGYKSGRGFYDWSEKSMPRLAAKRNRFVMRACRMLRELDEEKAE